MVHQSFKTLKAVLFAGLLLISRTNLVATSSYVSGPQSEACRLWEKLEHAVRDGKIERKDARRQFRKLWPQARFKENPPPKKGRWQWIFPVPGNDKNNFSSKSYQGKGYSFYDGPKRQGHPAIDIFVHDRHKTGLDDRNHKRIPIVAAMDGIVVSTQASWDPEDGNPEGVYVHILDQEDGRLFMYARLDKLKVGLGQVVSKGQVIGWAGRTGKDVTERNMKTHLHFEVHDFSDGLFYPIQPARALRLAKHLPWPLPDPNYIEPKTGSDPSKEKKH